MVRWLRWHCPPDTGFEIRALAVWGRARYLSVTEAPRNTDFHTWMGKKHFCFFQTAESGNRTPNSGVKGSGANHYPRAPAHYGNCPVNLTEFDWVLQKLLMQSTEPTMWQRRRTVFRWYLSQFPTVLHVILHTPFAAIAVAALKIWWGLIEYSKSY